MFVKQLPYVLFLHVVPYLSSQQTSTTIALPISWMRKMRPREVMDDVGEVGGAGVQSFPHAITWMVSNPASAGGMTTDE